MSINAISHVEWDTTDPVTLKDFLSGLFGWQFAPFGETYFITEPLAMNVSMGVNKNERAVVGSGTPNVYIDMASIDEAFAKVQTLGGAIPMPKTTIPGMGSYGFVKRPDGNLIGLWERNP